VEIEVCIKSEKARKRESITVLPGIDPGYSSSSPVPKEYCKILHTANSSVKYEICSSAPGWSDDPCKCCVDRPFLYHMTDVGENRALSQV
jgi:hypothetical protein